MVINFTDINDKRANDLNDDSDYDDYDDVNGVGEDSYDRVDDGDGDDDYDDSDYYSDDVDSHGYYFLNSKTVVLYLLLPTTQFCLN